MSALRFWKVEVLYGMMQCLQREALSPSGLAGRKKQREGASRHPEKGLGRPQSSSKPPNNSLVVVTCLGDYLKPLQLELGNKAPVVFSVIPKKILLVFNR